MAGDLSNDFVADPVFSKVRDRSVARIVKSSIDMATIPDFLPRCF
jgi:hypothetical protein